MFDVVGKVLKPQGIKGEIKILPLLTDFEDFKYFTTLQIKNNTYKVASCRVHQGYAYVKVEGITDCDMVETMRDEMVYASRDELPELNEGEYFITDLIGCVLVDQQNNRLGKITDVLNYGASDILQIMDGTEEILCPYLNELFVEVNLTDKSIMVDVKKFKELTDSED